VKKKLFNLIDEPIIKIIYEPMACAVCGASVWMRRWHTLRAKQTLKPFEKKKQGE
jgi:hypothetical protein